MLWLALHLPALSLEAWQSTLGPQQAGRPLALLQDHQILLADGLAQSRGVRLGMKRATALALAPDLLLGQADARRDTAALRAVAHAALAFSPSVVWATPEGWRPSATEGGAAGEQRPPPPDQDPREGPRPPAEQGHPTEEDDLNTATPTDTSHTPPNPAPSPALVGVRLEVQASLRYFGGLPALLARLRASIKPLGHRLRIASAPTALGAALLAAWRHDLADGPHSQDPHALQALLKQVPLQLLGPGQEHWQALQAMGLRCLGDLAGLPRSGLARRFSPELLQDIDRANGHAPEAHHWLTLPQRFASRIELQARADTSAQLLAGANILLPRLVAWAHARQVRILRFTLLMHHEPRHRHDSQAPERSAITIAPALPSVDGAHLHSLLAEHLARQPLPAPTLELSLLCSATTASAAPNGELFASQASQQEGLAKLVDRLQARLGRAQVQCFAAVSDHRPEQGLRCWPADAARLGAGAGVGAGAATGAGAGSGAAAGTGAHDAAIAHNTLLASAALATQPLWLLPQPQALHVKQQQPLLDGRPLQLLAGPQRVETGWWDSDSDSDAGPVLRDYFIAQASSGALVWVYRGRMPVLDGDGQGWYLQGLFG